MEQDSPIGIIGAMDDEIEMYLKHIQNARRVRWKIFTFHTGQLGGKPVVLVKSGVGKVFAAMIAQRLIDEFKVSSILFTGVGGSLNPKLKIGDVVVSVDSAHHDFDAQELGFKRGQISYTDYRFFKASEEMRKIALGASLDGHKIMAGRILTGDQFFTKKEKREKAYLREELKGDCVEMEGAAVAQVCVINDVPHLIIRSVSDQADGTAVQDYNKFKSVVAHNSFEIVKQVLERI